MPFFKRATGRQKTTQENHAIAKMTARCAQYMSALKIFESVD